MLESFALGTRLTRGRAYARAGQVLALEVAPGSVTATVQGSRPKPYQVSVGLRPFGEPLWARIETLLAGQALFSARLLAGDLPSELEQVFADVGAPLFPATVNDLEMRCNCPDFAVPCKHLAASFYLLAEAFDADPFQLLHWRGRDRERLLARLRALRAGAADREPGGGQADGTRSGGGQAGAARSESGGETGADASRTADAPLVGAVLALGDLPLIPLDTAVDRFWLPPVPLPSRTPTLLTEPDLLLRQLGAPDPAIGGPGLVERLRRAYVRFGVDQSD